QRLDFPRAVHRKLIKRPPADQPKKLVHLRPAPQDEGCNFVHWSFLVCPRENESAQLGITICRTRSFVFSDAVVACHNHPDSAFTCQHLDPFKVGRIATTWQVLDMVGTMTRAADESIECCGENGRRAVVEKDLHAASRRSNPLWNCTERR